MYIYFTIISYKTFLSLNLISLSYYISLSYTTENITWKWNNIKQNFHYYNVLTSYTDKTHINNIKLKPSHFRKLMDYNHLGSLCIWVPQEQWYHNIRVTCPSFGCGVNQSYLINWICLTPTHSMEKPVLLPLLVWSKTYPMI